MSTQGGKAKRPTNDYMKKQIELVKYMKEHDFEVDTHVIGAPQKFISTVSKRDKDPKHEKAADKLKFVEEYIKNEPAKAKAEYKKIEDETRKKKEAAKKGSKKSK